MVAVAWYSANSSWNVGMLDVSNAASMEMMVVLVDAWFSVKGSSVVVAVAFMMFLSATSQHDW